MLYEYEVVYKLGRREYSDTVLADDSFDAEGPFLDRYDDIDFSCEIKDDDGESDDDGYGDESLGEILYIIPH